MAVLIAVCLPVVLILAAFAVDVAYMQLVRTELRIATDAAALAGGRELRASPEATVIATAQEAAGKNTVGGSPFQVHAADTELGVATQPNSSLRWQFTPGVGAGNINAFRVTGRKQDGSAAGTATLFFGNIWGHEKFEPVKSAVSIQVDRDIALVLDRSASMSWNRQGDRLSWTLGGPLHPHASWISLQNAVNRFLDALDSTLATEKVALTTFSNEAVLDVDLVPQYDSIRNRMEAITQNFESGRTATSLGMDSGLSALTDVRNARPHARKTIVLLTDGPHNLGRSPNDVAGEFVAQHDVTIHTVTFASSADQSLMETVAKTGGGQHWHANDEFDLIDVFKAIADSVPTLLID